MSHLWYGIAFIPITLSVLYGMHRYVWARFVRDTQIERRWKIAATVTLLALGLLIPAAFLGGRSVFGAGRFGVTLTAYTWLGVLFYAVLMLGLLDVLRMLVRVKGRVARAEPENESPAVPDRRVFLARSLAGVAAVSSGGVALSGYRSATGEIATPETAVKLDRLPSALSGYRIAQLSDVHLGPLLGGRFLEHVVEKTNALRPDLIVITGDLVDAPVRAVAKQLEPLAKLRARHGVVFVTGNHEYYSGAPEWIEYLRQRGVRVLLNDRVELGDAGASFDLAGLPDLRAGTMIPEHTPDLKRALAGRDPDRALVLLAHQPAAIEMAENHGVGLMIAGHTHGGQMWPFGALVSLVQPYIAGLYRHPDGTYVYVSRGTGFWGPPMRVANPAEIASIVLTS
jgi:predicted MPP superfamily phosphohydrolase